MSKKAIFIIGATSTGKTKLAVSLAKRLNAEIVSADSMKIYKGLDIASSKLPSSERTDLHCHMVSQFRATQNITVKEYFLHASKAISEIHSKNKIPIIVGGTFYYIESLIFQSFLRSNDALPFDAIKSAALKPKYTYERLCDIDPKTALKLHPNDTRKIINSLLMFDKTGRRQSELSPHSNLLSYDSIFLWISCDLDVLSDRTDSRVDRMVASGLLEEIYGLRREVFGREFNVCQAIGFKELSPFFEKFDLNSVGLKYEEKLSFLKDLTGAFRGEKSEGSLGVSSDLGESLNEGISQIKLRTRQYVRAQVKWIRNRFLSRPDLRIFRIESTDLAKWDITVIERAFDISKAFVEEREIPLKEYDENRAELGELRERYNSNWRKYFCEVCKVSLNGLREWEAHLKSRKHRRRSRRRIILE